MFIVGGITYEEAYNVAQFNAGNERVILGGTFVHNSKTYVCDNERLTNAVS